jgi:hypothetical protein
MLGFNESMPGPELRVQRKEPDVIDAAKSANDRYWV